MCGFNCTVIQSPKNVKGHTPPLYQDFNCCHQLVSLKHDQICSSITRALLINYSAGSLIHSDSATSLRYLQEEPTKISLTARRLCGKLYQHVLCQCTEDNRWHGPREVKAIFFFCRWVNSFQNCSQNIIGCLPNWTIWCQILIFFFQEKMHYSRTFLEFYYIKTKRNGQERERKKDGRKEERKKNIHPPPGVNQNREKHWMPTL